MNKQKIFTKPILVAIFALFCTLLWGSAFPCIKLGYELFNITDTNSKILFAGVRFFIAGILTVIIGSSTSKKLILPSKKSGYKIALLALFQTVLQYVFFYIGLSNTSGVKGSIIEATSVFFVIILASFFFCQEKFTAVKIISCVIGFVGVVIVNLDGTGLNPAFTLTGEGFLILNAISYAFSSVLMRKFSQSENPVMLSGYQFILGGAVMSICSFVLGGRLHASGIFSIILLLYMAFISAAAYSIWSVLLKYNKASKITIFSFMTTIFGVILSAVILNEYSQINLRLCVAAILVCLGIFISSKFSENK